MLRLPSFGDRLVVCDCDRLTCCSGGVEVEDWLLADDWVVHTFMCEYIALFSKYNLWPFFLLFQMCSICSIALNGSHGIFSICTAYCCRVIKTSSHLGSAS